MGIKNRKTNYSSEKNYSALFGRLLKLEMSHCFSKTENDFICGSIRFSSEREKYKKRIIRLT